MFPLGTVHFFVVDDVTNNLKTIRTHSCEPTSHGSINEILQTAEEFVHNRTIAAVRISRIQKYLEPGERASLLSRFLEFDEAEWNDDETGDSAPLVPETLFKSPLQDVYRCIHVSQRGDNGDADIEIDNNAVGDCELHLFVALKTPTWIPTREQRLCNWRAFGTKRRKRM